MAASPVLPPSAVGGSSAAAVSSSTRYHANVSSILRRMLDDASFPTLDQEIVARQDALARRRRRRDASDGSSGGGLPWSRFVRGIPPSVQTSAAGRQARRTFSALCRRVGECFGAGSSAVPEDEVAGAVGEIFGLLSGAESSSVTGEMLCDRVGLQSCSAVDLEEFRKSVSELDAWRSGNVPKSLRRSLSHDSVEGGGSVSGSGGGGGASFGGRCKVLARDSELGRLWVGRSQREEVWGERGDEEDWEGEEKKEDDVDDSIWKSGSVEWLLEKCTKLRGSEAAVVVKQILQAVLETQPTSTQAIAESGTVLQGKLVDLLGFDDAALAVTAAVVEAAATLRAGVRTAGGIDEAIRRGADGASQPASSASVRRRHAGVGITVEPHRSAQSKKSKERRPRGDQPTVQDRFRGQGGGGASAYDPSDPFGLRALGLGDLGVGSGGAVGVEQRIALPPGTTETAHRTHREVVIPAATREEVHRTDLVPVTDLEEEVRSAFAGMERLNALQSSVFPAAYYSPENILVCAPTGAGKTNVAMLAVCRQLLRRQPADNSKIVYVAPMKALAAEVTATFGRRLASLGVSVRELTGDMQLTRKEMIETDMIVTTPEKWDVVTRKAAEGGGLGTQVALLIIDEIHLLESDRGAVLEAVVARTLRMVEAAKADVRLVGLSATLPNYRDVAMFLRVNPSTGLFHFSGAHRPVPLEQTFIGLNPKLPPLGPDGEPPKDNDDEPEEDTSEKAKPGEDGKKKGGKKRTFLSNSIHVRNAWMTRLAYEKCIEAVKSGKQAMVFVHSRKDTGKTARAMAELAQARGDSELLRPSAHTTSGKALALRRDLVKSRNTELKQIAAEGFGMHHAGMLRADRTRSEKLFLEGEIKILCCTATLAWGVNLPAHLVVIKGTQLYNAEAGGFTELSMLDVMQILGRAGRPQFDTVGRGCIITTHDALPRYMRLLTHQTPIESSFIKQLPDHLNAEIVSGTVANLKEAVQWLSYSYLYIRMLRNPIAYGISLDEKAGDPLLEQRRITLVHQAAKRLDECRMVRYDERSGALAVTDLGRTASHFYLQHESVDVFYRAMEARSLEDWELLALMCKAAEFQQVRIRDDEVDELDALKTSVPLRIKADVASSEGKVNLLLQAYLSRLPIRSFTLISDSSYVQQSAGRIARGLFEIALRKGWSATAAALLRLALSIDKRVWWFQSPLYQISTLSFELVHRTEQRFALAGGRRAVQGASAAAAALEAGGGASGSFGDTDGSRGVRMLDHILSHDDPRDLSDVLKRGPHAGTQVLRAAKSIPRLDLHAVVHPITRGILRVTLECAPAFEWVDRLHGTGKSAAEPFWVWVEDAESENMYHSEYVLAARADVRRGVSQTLTFTIPVAEPLPPQYWVRAASDRWLGGETVVALSFQHLILPDRYPPHTDLLDLVPLPKTALRDPKLEAAYSFSHFNPVQTQFFHCVYETDHNVLLGAPTGSGKTLCAELAIYRLWREYPGAKAVYVAPLKALVSERMRDWGRRIGEGMGRKVVELTGDVTPDARALAKADVVVTTPEKWDGISRAWQRRGYVRQVGLVIMDEIHLLGEERGPVLEVIVSRMRYISARTDRPIRLVGLSTALANAPDLADWLGIHRVGLFNFRPSVRPTPMEVHVQGYSGRHYCPRMALMNKPTYASILAHAPDKPALVFVSSRRQTRLTALELIALAAADDSPQRFLHMPAAEAEAASDAVRDVALKQALLFGVGMHHAGLPEKDRVLVETLFAENKIQVLVCTSTLAWGVNLPARLVVIKGTEFFDGKLGRYVDFPITDVLQMIGRAGRPQFDDRGVATIMVHEPKKNFYKKFLYEPFPVESQLRAAIDDHLAAEIVAGTITSREDAVEYLTWTYFFRRLLRNPAYYDLEDSSNEGISRYLLDLVDSSLQKLQDSGVVLLGDAAWDELVQDSGKSPSAARVALNRRQRLEAQEAMPALPSADGTLVEFSNSLTPEEEELLRGLPSRPSEAVAASTLGHVASFYYLSHRTLGLFRVRLGWDEGASTCKVSQSRSAARASDIAEVCRLLSDATEFDELPVRHNEDELNGDLARLVPWAVDQSTLGDAHTKAFLLLQAHMARVKLPIADYVNDTKSVLDQAPRVLNAIVDVAADAGRLGITLAAMELSQCLIQARFPWDPTCDPKLLDSLAPRSHLLAEVLDASPDALQRILGRSDAVSELVRLPRVHTSISLLSTSHGTSTPSSTPTTPQTFRSIDVLHRTISSIPNLVRLPRDIDSVACAVELRVENLSSFSTKAPASKWPRSKTHGGWVVIGDPHTNNSQDEDPGHTLGSITGHGDLLAIQRFNLSKSRPTKLTLSIPTEPLYAHLHEGEVTAALRLLTVYVISDCIRGIDQEYSIPILIE